MMSRFLNSIEKFILVFCLYSAHLRGESLSLLNMEGLLIFLHTSDRYLNCLAL